MIFLMGLAVALASLECREVCCGGVCQEMCYEDFMEYECPVMVGVLEKSQGSLCMKEFLLAETEIRTLIYYVKYYDFSKIFHQFVKVLKLLPLFHAECYSYLAS